MIQNLQNIQDAIYSAIKSSVEDLNPSGNEILVYELLAPQNTLLPVCVYSLVTDVVTPALAKSVSEEITLQVNFFGQKSLGSKALRTISDQLFEDLDRSTLDLTVGGAVVQGIVQGITTLEEDGNIINIRQEYRILTA